MPLVIADGVSVHRGGGSIAAAGDCGCGGDGGFSAISQLFIHSPAASAGLFYRMQGDAVGFFARSQQRRADAALHDGTERQWKKTPRAAEAETECRAGEI